MKKISFYQNKGGVGKTSLVINTASELAANYKVLVIDFDGQANCSRFFTNPVAGLETALVKPHFSPSAALRNTRYANIDILSASPGLNLIAGQFEQLSDEVQTANVRKILDYDSIKYDYVLIDLPPALNKIPVNYGLINLKIIKPTTIWQFKDIRPTYARALFLLLNGLSMSL